MTIEELRDLANTSGLTAMETVQVKLKVAELEELALARKAIESCATIMVRFANGMETAIEKQYFSVR